MNPISRLAQIQQAKKEKEPEYMLLTERGLPRRREFVMQVSWWSCRQPFSDRVGPDGSDSGRAAVSWALWYLLSALWRQRQAAGGSL